MSYTNKLKKALAKVESELEKVRGCSPLTHGWQTQRYSRADRNWDYFAQKGYELKKQIERCSNSEPREMCSVHCDCWKRTLNNG